MIYSVSLVHYSRGPYGPIQHAAIPGSMLAEDIAKIADNLSDVDMTGVNHLVIDTDARKIVYVSGYTPDTGLFDKVI